MTTPDNNTTVDKIQKWIPDRKALAGGLAGLVTFLVTTGLPDIPADAVGAIVAGVMGIVFYLVPPSKADLIRRADETLKALGDKEGGEATVVIEAKANDSK